jgi:hypothetical protein
MRLRLAILALSAFACARAKTTDELRAELRRGDSVSAREYLQPCETPTIDDFGWRTDSIAGVTIRLPSAIRSRPSPAYAEREYRLGQGSLFLWLAPDAGQLYRQYVESAPRWRETLCEVGGRPADVGMPLQKNRFWTVIRWSDAAGGETLVAVVRARTLDELRTLRAVLFTLRFPDG